MSLLGDQGGTGQGGGTGSGGGGNAGAGGGAGNAGANSGGGGGQSASWRDSLPEDIRANPALAQIHDIPSLAKSFVHAQSVIGKKGVFPPGEKATDEEWTQFFKSIGQPELEKFEIALPKDKQTNPELVTKFKALAHKNGLLPKQAQALMDWYVNEETGAADARTKASKLENDAQLETLKKDWGEGYDKQVALARLAVNELGGEVFQQYLTKSGLADNAQLARFMAKVGKLLGEDKIRGDGGGKLGQTREEIQGEINKVMGDPKHPYFDASHAGHKQALSHMEGLYRKLHA